jgi:hypothetical protein
MSRSRLPKGLVAATLGLLICSAAGAATRIGIVPLQPGDRAIYDFTSTTYTPGREDHEDGSFDLVRGKNASFELDFLPDGALNETYHVVLAKDGTVVLDITSDTDQPPFVLERFNQIATLVGSAPPAFKSGDSWKTKVNVPLPRGQSVDVPVLVQVSAATDTDFDIQANGEIKTQLNLPPPTQPDASSAGAGASAPMSSGAGLPLTLNLHTSVHVVAGKLDKADGTLHSTVQSRDVVEITSKWALVARKPAPN